MDKHDLQRSQSARSAHLHLHAGASVARTITIGEEDARLRANGDDLVVIPKSDAQISALLGVLPLQLLSYHMSVMRGFDPDFPRNLSKTLTVD